MKKYFFLLASLLILHSASCEAYNSMSFSQSGSGYLTNSSRSHYSYYIYLYAYLDNYSGVTESHTFQFSGALEGEQYAYFLEVADDWLIYEGINYYIALPYKPGESIYVRKKGGMRSPRGYNDWIAISDPIW